MCAIGGKRWPAPRYISIDTIEPIRPLPDPERGGLAALALLGTPFAGLVLAISFGPYSMLGAAASRLGLGLTNTVPSDLLDHAQT